MSLYKITRPSYYDQENILKAVVSAMGWLWLHQPDLSEWFSEETLEHEPNLSFHFANEIRKHFPELDCDFDLIKRNLDNKRPDIIFHLRWRQDFNILAIEIKRIWNKDVRSWRCESDENKILKYWFSEPLCYKYGLSLIINEQNKECSFSLLTNGVGTGEAIRRFHLNKKGDFSEI